MTPSTQWLAVALVLATTAPLAAETSLRWKLTPGERLAIVVEQQTTSAVTAVARTTTTQMDLTMTLDWHVEGVDGERITLRQALRRATFRMDSANVGRVTYDSAARARPIGPAREIAAAIAPLLDAEYEIVMNARGEVLDAKPVGEAAAAAGGDAAAGGAAPFSRERIEQLLRQPLALLPDKAVSAGDTWQRESELDTTLGKAKQTTTYEYIGPVEDPDGSGELHKIATKSELEIPMPAGGERTLTLKSHEQAGTILFSAALGRLVSAEQTQTLATDRPYRDTTIGVTLTSKQTTTVNPSAANAGAAPPSQ